MLGSLRLFCQFSSLNCKEIRQRKESILALRGYPAGPMWRRGFCKIPERCPGCRENVPHLILSWPYTDRRLRGKGDEEHQSMQPSEKNNNTLKKYVLLKQNDCNDNK